MASNGGKGKVSAGQAAGGSPVFDSYARLSWNPSTRELEKIETQHHDNEATIARHGGTVGQYLDDGLSAWKVGVRRKDFETLLERAKAGLTQGIAVWHVDRLFRQPRDLERLIDLADQGFRVISSHGSRDLSDPGRPVGGPHGFGFDRFERRVRARGASGRPAGDARPDTSEERPRVPAEQIAAEQRALREAVAGLLAGLTNQSEVARAWNAAGLFTVAGQRWTSPMVRETLMRPILAGRIEHEGELIRRALVEPEGTLIRLQVEHLPGP